MKKYIEMTKREITEVVNKGGDDKRRLNQMVADHLDALNLSSEAQDVIFDTDINAMAETFGGLFTKEEIENCIKENY